MNSLQVHYPPKKIHHSFTAGTDSLYELIYNVDDYTLNKLSQIQERSEAELRNKGIELIDLSSNNFKSTYNILTK